MPAAGAQPLWRCPRCGRRFAKRHQSRRVETISPRNHVHHFRLTAPGDIDAEFSSWLREAYAVGAQEHLRRRGAAASP